MDKHIEELKTAALAMQLSSTMRISDESITFRRLFTPDCILNLLAKLEAAEKGNEFLKEQLAQLANFNPDWDKLEACQESWRELAELQKETLQRAEAAEARLLVPWIQRSEKMPDPKDKRRVCVFTPNPAADLRYRLVPANLFKAVCSSATHWHYVDDPVEGGE